MPQAIECVNSVVGCKGIAFPPDKLCHKCKEEARLLDATIEIENRIIARLRRNGGATKNEDQEEA